MMYLLQQIFVVILLGCLFIALLYFAATIIVAALVVGALATLYLSVRFYFLRRKLKGALAEYHETSYSDAFRQDNRDSVHDMSVIDVEYVEVAPEEKADKEPRS